MRAARLLALALGLALVTTSVAGAELSARGDLLVRFSGGIAPQALPRHGQAPISVRVASAVDTFSGERPPALRKISIALNRAGRIDTRGLPTCEPAQVETASSQEARRICGGALLGGGRYSADVAFPDQSSFPSQGRVLAFNARIGGSRAILAHIFGSKPALTSRIVIFSLRQGPGTFGTVLTGTLPEVSNRYGYVTGIGLSLHREFTYNGRHRSYLSAGCAAPPGFGGASFPFAKVSMSFSNSRSLSSTLTRTCRVRGE